MKRVIVELPEGRLKLLDELVESGLYKNRDEAVQNAIKDLLVYHKKI